MKPVKFINSLPTLFAVAAIFGLPITQLNPGLGLSMVFGGSLLAAVAAFVGIVIDKINHQRGWVHIINIAWFVLASGFLVVELYAWSHFSFTF